MYESIYIYVCVGGGLPLITYAPRGSGVGVKPLIHFHCLLHAKRGKGVQIACIIAYVLNRRSLCLKWPCLREDHFKGLTSPGPLLHHTHPRSPRLWLGLGLGLRDEDRAWGRGSGSGLGILDREALG